MSKDFFWQDIIQEFDDQAANANDIKTYLEKLISDQSAQKVSVA